MLENEFLADIRKTAKLFGVTVYHTHRSDRSEPGFPDLTLVGSRGVLFRELKTEKGKLSAHQVYWLQILTDAGADAGVWRPSDFPTRVCAELKALGRAAPPPPPTQAQLRRKLARRKAPAT